MVRAAEGACSLTKQSYFAIYNSVCVNLRLAYTAPESKAATVVNAQRLIYLVKIAAYSSAARDIKLLLMRLVIER